MRICLHSFTMKEGRVTLAIATNFDWSLEMFTTRCVRVTAKVGHTHAICYKWNWITSNSFLKKLDPSSAFIFIIKRHNDFCMHTIMLPLEVILKAMIIELSDRHRQISSYMQYTVYRYQLTQSWCEYALLHTSSPRRKQHNIGANIHQDESSP